MSIHFPSTAPEMLNEMKHAQDGAYWQLSWKRFLELYTAPIEMVARSCYKHHTGGQEPSSGFIEDVVANTVTEFFSKDQYRYEPEKGRFRTFLRTIINARVVDLLRKERPIDHKSLSKLSEDADYAIPPETNQESEAFTQALLASLLDDLRGSIPERQLKIFERVKLKHQSPKSVAEDLGIERAVVDRNVYNVMQALRELASQSGYQEAFYE